MATDALTAFLNDPHDPSARVLRAIVELRHQTAKDYAAKLAEMDQSAIAFAKALPPIPGVADIVLAISHVLSGDPLIVSEKKSEQRCARATQPAKILKPAQNDLPFFGISISQASRQQLEKSRKPMSSREIAEALIQAGYPFSHEDPAHGIHNQMTKALKAGNDIIRFGGGKWALKEWYTQAELDEIAAALNGTPGRDAELHSQRVREAIAASQHRGVKFGRKSFDEIYPAKVLEEFRHLRAGGTSLKEALAAIGMPMPTYRKHKAKIEAPPEDQAALSGRSTDATPEKVVHFRRAK